jgi:hypothetical protein
MESIACPNCSKAVRVPSEQLGAMSACPFCKCRFIAEKVGDGPAKARFVRRNPLLESRAIIPGLVVFLMGMMALVYNGVEFVKATVDPELFAEQARESLKPFLKEDDNLVENTVKWVPRIRFVGIVLALLSISGGICMMKRRFHTFAMLTGFTHMFNVTGYCCFGIPIGGWALYTLMNPQVQDEFIAKTKV